MEEKSDVQWDDVKEIAEHVIVNLPRLVNKHRRIIDQHYDTPEAKMKLRDWSSCLPTMNYVKNTYLQAPFGSWQNRAYQWVDTDIRSSRSEWNCSCHLQMPPLHIPSWKAQRYSVLGRYSSCFWRSWREVGFLPSLFTITKMEEVTL